MRTSPITELARAPAGVACRVGRGGGFTLIELLLAISLGAVVLTAVYAIYSGVARSAQRVEAAADEVQAWRFFAERLRRDLANLAAAEFNGESQGLGLGIVAADGSTVQVRYGLFETADGLEIRRNAGTAPGVAVYQGVERLGFRYYDGEVWHERSGGEGDVPRAMECSVSRGGRHKTLILGVEVNSMRQASGA